MKGYLTIGDAAKRLGIKHNAMLRRVQRGYVRGRKVGWIWMVPISEIDRIKKTVGRSNVLY